MIVLAAVGALHQLPGPAVDPPHPGETFSELWLGPPGISITATAAQLKISRKTLSEIVNARVAISVEMGLAFGKSAESWLGHQSASDLWRLKGQRKQLGVKQHKQCALKLCSYPHILHYEKRSMAWQQSI